MGFLEGQIVGAPGLPMFFGERGAEANPSPLRLCLNVGERLIQIGQEIVSVLDP